MHINAAVVIKNEQIAEISRMRRNETPYPIWMKFRRTVDIHDVIT